MTLTAPILLTMAALAALAVTRVLQGAFARPVFATLAVPPPRATPLARLGGAVSEAAESEVDERPRLMLIEDDDLVRRIAARILSRDFAVSSFSHPADALKRLSEVPVDHYPLIVTDIVLPGMSGTDFVRRARENGVTAAFVLMSGYAPDAIVRGQLPPGCLFLAKPFDPRELDRVTRAAMAFAELQRVL